MSTMRKMGFPSGKETLPVLSLPAPCPRGRGNFLLQPYIHLETQTIELSFLIDDFIKVS